MTSPRKLAFDLLQIKYLLSTRIVTHDVAEKFIENYETILKDYAVDASSSHVSKFPLHKILFRDGFICIESYEATGRF